MQFQVGTSGVFFEIPDEWWQFAEMDRFSPHRGGGYFPYRAGAEEDVEVVPIGDVEPPQRSEGVPLFKKYKLLPVLFAFTSPECELPPVEVNVIDSGGRYRFRVKNGYHRFYASAAVGYTRLPIILRQPFEFEARD
ncbi:hypothetical protein GJ689_21500 [Rhodoplanes serenus]|uniref:ParB/Sulfiredoxin domain-containing protein n=1 Tax=Rhodoplanes serenus TaxID=200615 RepID=A0A9X4XP98_9BRAD|nr:hypothetical protein [Rhodoplanes serenus]MTW18780.1 hypothetical protein [Rhodoplanes serenus]